MQLHRLLQRLRFSKRQGLRRNAGDRQQFSGGLFRKYFGLCVAIVSVALVSNAVLDGYLSLRDQRALLVSVQRVQAEAAAEKIKQFVQEIEDQLGWTTLLPWSTRSADDWRFDIARLFRRVPAISTFIKLDEAGREQLHASQSAPDVIGSGLDLSTDPRFVEAKAHGVYFGPVFFRRASEPYMAIALAGSGLDTGVSVAEVNLKVILDVVSHIKVGQRGRAYVVDATGRLIAHPDISLVLRNLDLSHLDQVREAIAAEPPAQPPTPTATDIEGHHVLTASAAVAPLGWHVLVELPVAEAYAPLYDAVKRSAALLIGALVLAMLAALLLTRRMLAPIRALHAGAARIGTGDFGQRLTIKSGDELEALGEQFNNMAARLEESYATLERKVEERTHQLTLANLAKSRFLAAASHDLRQPLHALGLLIAELRGHVRSKAGRRVLELTDAAATSMSELFNALLDISKLDAGVVTPEPTELPINHLLARIEATFAGAAREKHLTLRVVRSAAWVRSDAVLLERILLNLVSNAIRYTQRGGVLVGCRRRDDSLRVEVWDSGPGIPEDQHKRVFEEFYRGVGADRAAGLGLGLAIVERLARVLGHRLELRSTVGRGSRFAVLVPIVEARAKARDTNIEATALPDAAKGQLVAVVDDDLLVLESMRGLLQSWGLRVVAGHTQDEVLAGLRQHADSPHLIICDAQLSAGVSGTDVIATLRRELRANVPAFLISGDTGPDSLLHARESGLQLLHKPLSPMKLRSTVNWFLQSRHATERAEQGASRFDDVRDHPTELPDGKHGLGAVGDL